MQIEVNFLLQIVQFHKFKRENEISANAQALWLELIGLFNTRRFPAEMPVSTTHLCTVLCVSKDTLLRARRELEALGLITVTRGVRGRASSVVAMRYFTKDCGKAVDNTPKPVDNPRDSVENNGKADKCTDDCREKTDEKTDEPACGANTGANCGANMDASICDANMDASCDANMDAGFCGANNGAYFDTRCDTNSANGAGCVEICDPYINVNPTVNQNEQNMCMRNVKPNMCTRNIDEEEETAATMRARAGDSGDHFRDVGKMDGEDGEERDFELVNRAMMQSFGRRATREEARTLVNYARIWADICDYTPLIPLALEMAAKYGARTPAAYSMTLMNQWRRHHLMTREDVENYVMLEGYCRDEANSADIRAAAEKELDAFCEDCFQRWMSRGKTRCTGGLTR